MWMLLIIIGIFSKLILYVFCVFLKILYFLNVHVLPFQCILPKTECFVSVFVLLWFTVGLYNNYKKPIVSHSLTK